MTTKAPITVRGVLRLLLAADSYPRLGNHDWREADLLEVEARQKATAAEPRADDPPEFARWLETLLTPGPSNTDREEVYLALHDFFDDGSHDGLSSTSPLPRLAGSSQDGHRCAGREHS
jgi:hypothetical protein